MLGRPKTLVTWGALIVVPALIAAATTAVVRSGGVDETTPDETRDPDAAVVELAPSGLVVTLERIGADLPIGLGTAIDFQVDVAAVSDIAQVELWQNDEVVATYEPVGETDRAGTSLPWAPSTAGVSLMTARAVDVDGRVGLSNPVWIETSSVPSAGLYDDDGGLIPVEQALGAAAGLAGPSGFRNAGAARPRAAQASDLPLLSLTASGCEVTVDASARAGTDLVLMSVPPGGRSIAPVASLAPDAGGAATLSALLGSGIQALLLAEVEGGSVRAWSAPALTEVGEGCSPPGWTGAVSLVDGRLEPAGAVDAAYLYVETANTAWARVPTSGTVVRTTSGLDFSGVLPPTSSQFAFRAWGWRGGTLVFLGSGEFAPPSKNTVTVGKGSLNVASTTPWTPSPKLYWVTGGSPPPGMEYIAGTQIKSNQEWHLGGVINVDPDDDLLGVLRFVWQEPNPSVTHGIVQVSSDHLSPKSGPVGVTPLFTCIIPAPSTQQLENLFDQMVGDFEIDFDQQTCLVNGKDVGSKSAIPASTYQALVGEAVLGEAVIVPIVDPDKLVSEVDPLTQLEKELADTIDAGSGPSGPEQRIVRVVPMVADTWPGKVSNDVVFDVDRTPTAPPGTPSFGLKVRIVEAPTPPDIRYQNCWSVEWKDPAAAQAAKQQEIQQLLATKANLGSDAWVVPNPYFQSHYFWDTIMAYRDPICAPDCIGVSYPELGTGGKVGFGKDCSSKSFLSDPAGWVYNNVLSPFVAVLKAVIDFIADGFAKLKSYAVGALMDAVGCTGALCQAIANAVVDGILIAAGIPPTLPNFDQLVNAAKGEIKALAVSLVEKVVPCSALSTAAEFHGEQGATCEGVVDGMLEAFVEGVNAQFVSQAHSGGLDFPSDMIVRPYDLSQVGMARVEVTVTPTKYSADRDGVTCGATLSSNATWTSPSLYVSIPGVAPAPEKPGAGIPKTDWYAPNAFAPLNVRLPDLGSELEEVTEVFSLASPVNHPMVTVLSRLGFAPWPVELSPYTFYLHQDAKFSVLVKSECAGFGSAGVTLDGSYAGKPVGS